MRTALARGLAVAVVCTAGVADAGADVLVTTVVDQDGAGGWHFNPDPAVGTPYDLVAGPATRGVGSLSVAPITNEISGPSDRFVAHLDVGAPVADFEYFAIDLRPVVVDGATLPVDAFTSHLDVNLPGSTTAFDCRFTIVEAGPTPAVWDQIAYGRADVRFGSPGSVTDPEGDGFTCPPSPVQMPAGSVLSRIAITLGDATVADTGVGAHFDNAYLALQNRATLEWHEEFFDFEPPPDSDGDGLPDREDPDLVALAVDALDPRSIGAGNRRAFLTRLDGLEAMIVGGDLSTALAEVESLRKRVDGCDGTTGERPDRNDWIITCADQRAIRSLLDTLAGNLST